MLDVKYIRENLEEVQKALLKRMEADKLDLESILSLDDKRRDLLQVSEALKAERNQNSKSKPDDATIAAMKILG